MEPTWCTTFFLNMFIAFLYMFRATMCPSSGKITVPMRHLVFVTLYRWLSGMQSGISTCIPDSHLYTVINTRCRTGTVIFPDNGQMAARNMWRKAINVLRKKFCTKLVLFTKLYKDARSTKHKKVNLGFAGPCIFTHSNESNN
jgi:hypothetical protein